MKVVTILANLTNSATATYQNKGIQEIFVQANNFRTDVNFIFQQLHFTQGLLAKLS